jgi:hypothetical protein
MRFIVVNFTQKLYGCAKKFETDFYSPPYSGVLFFTLQPTRDTDSLGLMRVYMLASVNTPTFHVQFLLNVI